VNRALARFTSSAWPAFATWLAMPLLAGPALAAALDGAGRPVQLVASAGLWAGWALVLIATLVPRTVSLTALRIVAPAGCVAAMVAAASASDLAVGWRLAALVVSLVMLGVTFAPSTGHAFVNGSSYGDEQRFCLRAPGPVLLGLVQALWVVVVAGTVTGPLLIAAEQWVPGAVALPVGWIAAWWGARVLHVLARRWVVLVPAGMVLHDQLALADPVLLRRADVAALAPAPAGSDAVDLTRAALGLALEVQLRRPAQLSVVTNGRGESTATVAVDRLLLTPTRPGALVAAARDRHLG
jgi:hypothetical protein